MFDFLLEEVILNHFKIIYFICFVFFVHRVHHGERTQKIS